MNKRKRRIFCFNMIEIALALVVLAVGLSSVLVLFPIGASAGKNSVTDNNLANVAEQLTAYIQSGVSAPASWQADGTGGSAGITAFTAEPASGAVPTSDTGFIEVATDSGLYKNGDNYIYRQFTTDSSGHKIVDFEVMIRVGSDNNSLRDHQYYPLVQAVGGSKWALLKDYTRTGDVTKPAGTRLNTAVANILPKCYQTLIMEFSWPIEAEWRNREKRIFRLEMFNENFVPYPQTP